MIDGYGWAETVSCPKSHKEPQKDYIFVSGAGHVEPGTGGSGGNQRAKADAGKLEIDMVPTQIIRDIAEVRMYGNAKYHDPQNWKTVELRRYINAMLRHTLAFVDDPYGVDSESGIPHYKHAECNWAFISEILSGRVSKEAEQ